MQNVLSIAKTERLLVVAPHPDDETVGCGGLLALYGSQCDVLLLTDGRKGRPADKSLTEEETATVRADEFEKAMAFFGVNSARVLTIPDGSLSKNAGAVRNVNLRDYHRIFVPYRNERHPDHAAAFRIIKKLKKTQHAKAELLEFEIWSPITAPNRFLDVSDVMERKLEGIRLYASQTHEIDYEALANGLNGYRGAPQHVSFCEAFYSKSAARRERRQERRDNLPAGLRKAVRKLKGK